MKQFKTFLNLSILLLALLSCKKEDNGTPQLGSVQFIFDANTAVKSAAGNAVPTAVVISVEDPEGKSVYKNKQISLTQTSNSYNTNAITFASGSYKLTKFLIIDADGNVLNATPMGFSTDASLVENPLPISFNVQLGNITKLMPNVASTENKNAQDFGYTSFNINAPSTFNFLFEAYVFNAGTNQFELTSTHISLVSDAGETIDSDLLSALDSIKVKEASNYILSVSKDGYQTWSDTLSLNDLLHYYANPMVVTLNKTDESSISFITVQDTLTEVVMNITGSDNTTPMRVNWGDGKIEIYTAPTRLIHDYAITGNYHVSLTGNIAAISKLGLTHARISSINLEKAINLTYIEISRNQKLKSLNLSNMRSLKEIYCVEGSIENLNLDNSDSIEQLYCSLNQIKSIDLSALSNLKTLYCDRNELTTLNTANNPNLNILYCYQNSLTALDITNNIKLATLDCRNNQLSTLDVSKSLNINTLLISYNNINNDNANKVLIDLLQTVKSKPRAGQISLSVTLSSAGETAREGLNTYKWTVNTI